MDVRLGNGVDVSVGAGAGVGLGASVGVGVGARVGACVGVRHVCAGAGWRRGRLMSMQQGRSANASVTQRYLCVSLVVGCSLAL